MKCGAGSVLHNTVNSYNIMYRHLYMYQPILINYNYQNHTRFNIIIHIF